MAEALEHASTNEKRCQYSLESWLDPEKDAYIYL